MDEKKIREQLAVSLSGKGAHVPFDKAVAGFPLELAGRSAPGLAHTAWQIVYHLWIAQWDILEFVRGPAHESPAWPEGYWPRENGPKASSEWETTVKKFRSDLNAMIELVRDAKNDLLARIPHGDGQTLLREALLVIDHNAYHVGQLVDVRRALGAWPG
ncbi:MAG: DinB family protein [Spirochaetia bacterium]|jgi:hypothetical protein